MSAWATGNVACADNILDVRSDGSTVRFNVEVADTVQNRATGLMNRESMEQFTGMLFVYPEPTNVAFWMRNTLIPLDMLFVDENGVVQKIHENAIPLDETSIPGGDNIKFVFEINGGLAKALNIAEESVMRHPAITGEGVVWSCD